MRSSINIIFALSLVLNFAQCENPKSKAGQLTVKNYGRNISLNENLAVELKTNEYEVFLDLINRVDNLDCSDSLPVLTLRNNDLIKKVYLSAGCPDGPPICVKYKNIIEIHNDSVVKNKVHHPIDSLESILKKDLENFGKNPELSDNPEKLVVFVSYTVNGLNKIEHTLNLVTDKYEKLTGQRDVSITLHERVNIPIPPMPKNIEVE